MIEEDHFFQKTAEAAEVKVNLNILGSSVRMEKLAKRVINVNFHIMNENKSYIQILFALN